MDKFIKVAGMECKVGGYFCRLLPLNENTVYYGALKLLHLPLILMNRLNETCADPESIVKGGPIWTTFFLKWCFSGVSVMAQH